MNFSNYITLINESSLPPTPFSVKGIGTCGELGKRDILYRARITPSSFLDITETVIKPDTLTMKSLRDALYNGDHLMRPYIVVEWDISNYRVVDHSGRHRMMTVQELYGDPTVTIDVIIRGGQTDSTLRELRKGVTKERTTTFIYQPFLDIKDETE